MTKNKDWTGNKHIYICNHRKKDSEVEEHEFYSTHPDSVFAFLDKCKQRNIVLPNKIWENCAGIGHISKTLESEGYEVLSTDLVDRGFGIGNVDVLKLERDTLPKEWLPYTDCIFTNPPYKIGQSFIEKSLELASPTAYVIMFLKLTFLESKARIELFNKHKLQYVFVHANRQGCGKNGGDENGNFVNGGASCYAWYIWKNDYNGLPELDWIE